MQKLFFLKIILIVFIQSIIAGSMAQADCAELVESLKELKAAQHSVSQSLVKNHELMSNNFLSYSQALSDSKGKAYKSIATNMGKISETFKARGEKADKLTQLISDKTDELIALAESCK